MGWVDLVRRDKGVALGAEGRGRGAGRPRSRTCSRWGASPPASNRCRRTTSTTTTTTTTTSTTSTPAPVSSSPPNPHDPGTSQPPPRRERSRRGWPRREGGRDAASAPQAQGQQGEPARGAEGAWPWDRDWGTVPDPLGDEALSLVGEVYGWLCWANQGTTRGLRNLPFDAVLLRRHTGNREVPIGGLGSPRGPREGPQVSDPGSVARQEADVAGLPGRGSGTPHHGCGRQQLAPSGFAQRPRRLALPPAQPATATAAAPTQATAQVMAQTADARKWGGELGPPTHAPPTVRRDEGARATSGGGESRDNERGGKPTAPQPANR